MTMEQKQAWVLNATVDELIAQFETSVRWLGKGTIEEQLERNEEYKMVKAELRRRMSV